MDSLGNKEIMARNLKHYIELSGKDRKELAKIWGFPYSTVTEWINGKKYPRIDRIEIMANYFNILKSDLIEDATHERDPIYALPNIEPLPKTRKVPILGSIACGRPNIAYEEYEGMAEIPDDIHADFALRCRGDSMINARIFDGDLVYIREQPTVENGQIAAVYVEDETTLKKVKFYSDHIILQAENPAFPPIYLYKEEMNSLRILGLAVAFTSMVKHHN